MKLLFSATNALNKWLKADFERLPHEEGKRIGVNPLVTDNKVLSWQVHIIDNSYKSIEKTIVATEAYSRFTLFIAVSVPFTVEELSQRLAMEWQIVFAETLENQRIMNRSDLAYLLSNIEQLGFMANKVEIQWVKNTDLSINGHIVDSGLWVEHTLRDKKTPYLTPDLALDLAIYLNTKPKKKNKPKETFIAVERLLAYFQQRISTVNFNEH